MNQEHGLQPILEELIRAGKVPGLSAAVVRDDCASWIGAAGLADIEQRRPATEATVYLWFSMTKIATATAVVQLAERGRLGLDEPVATYVPEFPHSAQGSPSDDPSSAQPQRWSTEPDSGALDPPGRSASTGLAPVHAALARETPTPEGCPGRAGTVLQPRLHRPR